MGEYVFSLTMKVRDYECDIQGVVNNANYLHYLEHTRHEFLESLGVSFGELHEKKVDAVVSHINISYKASLFGGNTFISALRLTKKGVKIIFFQQIIRQEDQKLCCEAEVEIVILENGKLTRGDYFDPLIKDYI